MTMDVVAAHTVLELDIKTQAATLHSSFDDLLVGCLESPN
jgi:hypothetical protein